MIRTLPPRPSLEQLKKQAKDLRKRHQSASTEAAERIKANLPKFSAASADLNVLAGLRDEHIRDVLREIDQQDCTRALTGAESIVRWRLLSNMSMRVRGLLEWSTGNEPVQQSQGQQYTVPQGLTKLSADRWTNLLWKIWPICGRASPTRRAKKAFCRCNRSSSRCSIPFCARRCNL